MTNSKHTPGPWNASFTNDPSAPIRFAITGPDGRGIVACASSITRDPATKLANGRLIAAAPELVAALRGVMRFALPITALDVEDFNRARAALAEVKN